MILYNKLHNTQALQYNKHNLNDIKAFIKFYGHHKVKVMSRKDNKIMVRHDIDRQGKYLYTELKEKFWIVIDDYGGVSIQNYLISAKREKNTVQMHEVKELLKEREEKQNRKIVIRALQASLVIMFAIAIQVLFR